MTALKKYLIITVILPVICFGKQLQYPVALIDKEVLDDANAVVRTNECSVYVNDDKTFTLTAKYAVTILKAAGKPQAIFQEQYDTYRDVKSLSIKIFDKNGKQIGKHSLSDCKDYSDYSNTSFESDVRIKYYDPDLHTLPYTVEYEYVTEYKSLLYLPPFRIFCSEGVYMENTDIHVTAPKTNPVHIYLRNTDASIKTEKIEGRIHQSLSFRNISYKTDEAYAKYEFPEIFLKTDAFSIDGYTGNYTTWKDFGKFRYELIKDRDNIPPSTADKVNSLLETCTSRIDTIKTIYRFVQNNTRYVSISYGLGGIQPRTAKEVAETSFGDCKALSNFTHALLKNYNILSYYTLIKAGRYVSDIDNEIVLSQFNHVILCVPDENDTIWLECTNQTNPFGYLSDFTDDRYALLITEDGGVLTRTPKYEYETDAVNTKTEIIFDNNFNATITARFEFIGLAYSDICYIQLFDREKQKKAITNMLGLNSFTLLDFSLDLEKERIPRAILTTKIEIRNYAGKSGGLTILPLNFEKDFYLPKKDKIRNFDVLVRHSRQYSDSVTYILPDGYSFDFIPEAENYETKYGFFKESVSLNNNSLSYVKQFALHKNSYDVKEYGDFYSFLEKLYSSNNKKAVLK